MIDKVRLLGWICVVIGLVIAFLSPMYATHESEQRAKAWRDSESAQANLDRPEVAIARLDRLIAMMNKGLVPSDTIASPWPVAFAGVGVTAFGVLLLAVRRPPTPSPPPAPLTTRQPE